MLFGLRICMLMFLGTCAAGKAPKRFSGEILLREKETNDYWVRLLQQDMSMPTTAPASCPDDEDNPLNLVFIGNSLTGGTSVGTVCPDDDDSARPDCQFKSIPGNVRGFFQDPSEPYPTEFDQPPDSDTLMDPSLPYNPVTNNHSGDVPSKIRLLAEYMCGADTFEYVQNTQSAMTTRSHAGQASTNPQNGTTLLLEGGGNDATMARPPYDIVLIQPQSTEYLDGATSARVSALKELTKPRGAAASPNVRFILQQTWPLRESTDEYNQICTTEDKKGMVEEIDKTLLEMSQNDEIRSFEVAPTGTAFVEFAKLACGPDILPEGACAFDSTLDCPIWYGASGKISLYHEGIEEEGLHQSDEIGAWLSASVLFGVIQSTTRPCYMSASDLERVMPEIPQADLADIPTGQTIYFLISEAARLALVDRYGCDAVVECVAGK